MAHDAPDVDPGLVEIENALDRHERVRKNSVDPQRLKRAAKQLRTVVHRTEDHNAAVEEYLAESREPEWREE
jgi:hypothetical protein